MADPRSSPQPAPRVHRGGSSGGSASARGPADPRQLSLLHGLAGQHAEAITIFEPARVGLRDAASLTVQAIVTGFEARARATAGDRSGFYSALARGATLYGRARVADAPPWAYWMMESAEFPTPLENGRALTMVGEPHRAIEILTPKVAAMAEYPRDAVLTQVYLAEAHAAVGERDQAAEYAAQARAGLAAGVQSPRTAAALAGLGASNPY